MTSSIANETVDHSKTANRSAFKFITNKYFLNVVSIVLFLALWGHEAKEKISATPGPPTGSGGSAVLPDVHEVRRNEP